VKTVSAPASRDHLDAIPLLSCLNPVERGILLPHCRTRVFQKGEVIFEEGDRSAGLLFVVFGSVKIVKASSERNVVIGLLGPGDPIGIVAAFQSTPFPASAIVVETSTILLISEGGFFGIADRHPEITRQLLQMFMSRQTETAQRLQDQILSAEQRVAKAFLVLSRKIGQREGEATLIPLWLNRQDVADLAGTAIETAIRIMSRWGKAGIVLTQGHTFLIPDMKRLESIADAGNGEE
jgi:CRP-like cAMP-binding protein